jgi:hypothetical protein
MLVLGFDHFTDCANSCPLGLALGPINAENDQDAIYSKLTVQQSNYLLQANQTLKHPSQRLAAGGNISAPLHGTRWVSQNPVFQIRMLETGFLKRILTSSQSQKAVGRRNPT